MIARVYTFLPYFRRGAAASVDGAAGGRGVFALSLSLNQLPIVVPIEVHGPADVAGIDRRVVRRFEPAAGVIDAEPYAFASVELSLPDLPWMFTPARPSDGRLSPWLALVVVRADKSTVVTSADGATRLEIASARGELPDPAEAWAWAHVQLVGDIDLPLDRIAAEQPERMCARLVCPRKLDPGVAWRACVVPVFAGGRAAGLGEAARADPLAPAWDPTADAVTLPVYLHWTFATSSDADFETLAARMVARTLPPTVGVLPIDASEPGGGVRGVPGQIAMPGPLGLGGDPPPLPDEAASTVEDLTRIVTGPVDPLEVSPPRYPATADVNTDPRWRAAAGLGADVVRRDQEQLVASAWDQVGEAREANRQIGWLRLARQVAVSLHRKHFSRLSLEGLATVSAPAHARLRLDTTSATTLRVALRAHLPEPSAVSPVFRRAVRPTRRAGLASAALADVLVHEVDATRPRSGGLVTLERVFQALGSPAGMARMQFARLTDEAIDAIPRRDRFWVVNEQGQGFHPPAFPFPHRSPDEVAFRLAARTHLAAVERAHGLAARRRPPRVVVPLDRANLLAALDPTPVFRAIATSRIGGGEARDALDRVTGAPTFNRPAFKALPDRYLLPGLEHVPANTTSVMFPEPKFAQAFLAGMNHELARELLWREFPCAPGAVFFRSFWGNEGVRSVLIVRGDLVRRFPGLSILSVPATASGAADLTPGREMLPVFRGGMEPDVLFAGFPFDRDTARARFFILQARPTAPRFGLDSSSEIPIASLQQRNDLAWSHIPSDSTHASVAGPLMDRVLMNGLEQATWGRTAADQAWLTLQLPVRLVVPGNRMVP
jgi:hypothetical protein